MPPGETISCSQCGATLAIANLAEANASVQALAPALRAAAEKPAPEVVKRRLDALEADLPRRRDWVAGMQAEADARRGRGEIDWSPLVSRIGSMPTRVAVLALAAWVVWRFWR